MHSLHVCFIQSWGLHNLRIVPEEIVVGDMCKVATSAMQIIQFTVLADSEVCIFKQFCKVVVSFVIYHHY